MGGAPDTCLRGVVNAPGLHVRALRTSERPWLRQQLIRLWGSIRIVSRGAVHDASTLAALVCLAGEEIVGLATFDVRDHQCELVTIDAFEEGEGIGSALLAAVGLHVVLLASLALGGLIALPLSLRGGRAQPVPAAQAVDIQAG